jgi:hypothetical protein
MNSCAFPPLIGVDEALGLGEPAAQWRLGRNKATNAVRGARTKDKKMRPYGLLLIVPLALAACAAPGQTAASGAPEGRDCFNSNLVNGFETLGDDTVRVSSGPRNEFDLKISGPTCSNITWANAVSLRTRGSPWICTGNSAGIGDIRFRDSAQSQVVSCTIESVTRAPPRTTGAPSG